MPIQIPIGAEEKFEGVVDLVHDEGDLLGRSVPGHEVRVPRDSRRSRWPRRKEWREKMVEAAAEANEELMNKYLESGELSIEEIKHGLRMRTIANEIVPMLCGSAFKNKGVQAMLDAVIDYLPSPVDIPPVKGEIENGEPTTRKAVDDEPFAALAFKIMTDPFVGQLIVLPRLFRRGEVGRYGLQPDQGQEGAHRPPAADARQPARGNQGSARRRHRRGGRPEGSDHRRNAVRSEQDRSSSSAWCSRSR